MRSIPTEDNEGKYTAQFRAGIRKARADLAKGRTLPHEEAKRRLGLD